MLVLVASCCCGRSYATLRGKGQASKQKVLGDGQENVSAMKLSPSDNSDAQLNTELNTLQAEQAKAAAVATITTPTTTTTPTTATTPTTTTTTATPTTAAVPSPASLLASPVLNPKLTGTVTLNSFDNFAYINLAKRDDRRKRIEGMLASFQIDPSKVHRIEALPTPELGAKGCSFSHLKAIDLAIERNWDHVVIFEDDFEFTASPTEVSKRLTDFFAAYPGDSWDVFMFVGNIVETQPTKLKDVLSAKQVLAASGYVVNRPFFNTLRLVYLSSYNELSVPECLKKTFVPWQKMVKCRPLDVLWMKAMQAARWFVCKPPLGRQIPGYSDIERKPVDYNIWGT